MIENTLNFLPTGWGKKIGIEMENFEHEAEADSNKFCSNHKMMMNGSNFFLVHYFTEI